MNKSALVSAGRCVFFCLFSYFPGGDLHVSGFAVDFIANERHSTTQEQKKQKREAKPEHKKRRYQCCFGASTHLHPCNVSIQVALNILKKCDENAANMHWYPVFCGCFSNVFLLFLIVFLEL